MSKLSKSVFEREREREREREGWMQTKDIEKGGGRGITPPLIAHRTLC